MVEMLVWLAVLVIVIIVAWWLLSQVTLDPMIRKIITIGFVVVVAVVVIVLLLNVAGMGPPLKFR